MHYSSNNTFIISERSINIIRNIVYYTLEKRKYKKTSRISTFRELGKAVKVSPFNIDNWVAGEYALDLVKIFEMLNVLSIDIDKVFFMLLDVDNITGGEDKKEWLRGQQQAIFANLKDVSIVTNMFEVGD